MAEADPGRDDTVNGNPMPTETGRLEKRTATLLPEERQFEAARAKLSDLLKGRRERAIKAWKLYGGSEAQLLDDLAAIDAELA